MKFDIFNSSERIVKCVEKYDTSPYSCDYELLEIGKKYTVTNVDMFAYYTMITLKEFPGKRFNSVLFAESENEELTNEEALNDMLRKTFPRTIFIRGINETNKTQSIVFSDEWLKMPYEAESEHEE